MNPNYNYLNNNQSYYQQNMNNMYQGQNGNYNQLINNGAMMMNNNQNTAYMNQMNYNNNLLNNQYLMNNNRSKSHNAYFVGRFGQNNFNNNMFNNPTFYNNNMSNNLNNMNSLTNNINRYNNIGSINNSNNFNNMNNNNNISSFNNNSFYNNMNSYNNFQNMNNMNSFNNNTMNNNNTFNNMNNINNNVAMSNTNNSNNIKNTNNIGIKNTNINNMFNPQTMIISRKQNNPQRKNYNKRDSKANKIHLTNNISTFKEEPKDYQKRIIDQNKSDDKKKETTNKNEKKNQNDINNLKKEIPNYNEQLKQKEKNDIKKESLTNDNQNSTKDSCNNEKAESKPTKDIKEEKPSEEEDLKLTALIKARGLENVGATCYMNATLQCLYHVKQLSESLVNDDKIDEKLELTYSFKKLIEGLAFTNIRKYKIDRKYNIVTGENIKSFKPENFKEVLSKKNPQFKGIKANDSKDLIMYLFQEMDKELTLRNNNSEKMEMFIGNDESDIEKENFKKFHNSIFGDLFYGFQKSDMICYNCRNCNSTYNVFNNLVLPIEKTYNSLNDENKKKNRNNNVVNMLNPLTCQTFNKRPALSARGNYNYGYNNNYNNFNNTPDLPRKLKVYDCLKEMLKDEILSGENQIYCNKCKRMCNSINRTILYKTPNILVLILNRGKGNSFECEIEFSSNEILDLSQYNIISPDSPKKYNLFGIISHIGESSDEGHFIAYCKHFDDNWYMFNDSIAKTVGENELTNGVPYILFYRNIDIDKEFGN